jgi:hypothetical protein
MQGKEIEDQQTPPTASQSLVQKLPRQENLFNLKHFVWRKVIELKTRVRVIDFIWKIFFQLFAKLIKFEDFVALWEGTHFLSLFQKKERLVSHEKKSEKRHEIIQYNKFLPFLSSITFNIITSICVPILHHLKLDN